MTRAGARQNAYTTDDCTNYHATFAKEDLETDPRDRGRPLPEPRVRGSRSSRPRRGRCSASTTRTPPSPIRKLIEVQREHAFTTHTYKHTTMGFLKDIEDMPNQFEYSKTFFDALVPARSSTTIIVAGDVEPNARASARREVLGRLEARHVQRRRSPQETAARTGRSTRTCRGPRRRLPWVTVAFHGPAFSRQTKDSAALDIAVDLAFGETSELYKRLVEQEQKVDQLFTFGGRERRPGALHRLRAREGRRRTRSTCATRS